MILHKKKIFRNGMLTKHIYVKNFFIHFFTVQDHILSTAGDALTQQTLRTWIFELTTTDKQDKLENSSTSSTFFNQSHYNNIRHFSCEYDYLSNFLFTTHL
jgi:hypothetical protein